ncbi:MAG: diaminopimelate epimerase [Tepidanaerobacter acetatoxydans]|jgi:diaminopimelate epimerase|uniref:diaminopimelate epimerase n=1 Tax=Tepidanaerobacter TaxID=499228 RepID=UPI000AE1DE60|nr:MULTISPECIES: diaminopimelate epimerase [Tepidanaerobacter]NLU09659.1 diaminopimelate epimerase [Tepidanaerobacter acetatoxydans]
MEKLPFMKMNGCGNDFIVVDNREGIMAEYDLPIFIKRVCARRVSVGADGFMMLEKSSKADFKMRYFNADGSEGEMCGNGARCISKFAYILGAANAEMTFETMAGIYESKILGENVSLKFPPVSLSSLQLNQTHNFEGETLKYNYAPVGVPHVVIYRDDVDTMDYKELVKLGRKIRYADIFPCGTNVNFLKILDESNILIRTYERGVEDETLACGTGSTASAIISYLLGKARVPINMHTRDGILKIFFDAKDGVIDNLWMQGNAKTVAEGYILPDAWCDN